MTDNRTKSGEASAQANHGDVSAAEVEKYLKGVDFPASRQSLVDHAKDNDAPDEVTRVINQFPDQDYKSAADVAKAIGDVK